jgi:hypothetical protein
MGLFDTFIGEYYCVSCGKNNQFEEQTKDFDNILAEFYLGDYVDKGNANYFYEFEAYCQFCHKKQELSIAIRRGQFVGVYHKVDADKIKICDLKNIEDGYQRRLNRERECREKIGREVEQLDGEYREKHVGEYIRALDTDWRICKAYKRERECMLDRGLFLYLVTDDKDIRRITEWINLMNQVCRFVTRIDCNSLDACTDDDVFAYAKEHYGDELVRIE